MGAAFPLEVMKNALKHVVTAAQLGECSTIHRIIHFEMVSFIVCEFYLIFVKDIKEAWVQEAREEREVPKVEEIFRDLRENVRLDLGLQEGIGFRSEEGRHSG